MARPRKVENFRIIGENWDFSWLPWQEERFIELWESGASILDIMTALKRNKPEVICLLMQLEEEERVKQRRSGLEGGDSEVHG